jgi:hypothetical protein
MECATQLEFLFGWVHADAPLGFSTKNHAVLLIEYIFCSNLYHTPTHIQSHIVLHFHLINGSRSPAPQQSEEKRRKEMWLCRSPHNTRASESQYAYTQRDWPDFSVAIAEAHRRSHSRQPRRALLQHVQQ